MIRPTVLAGIDPDMKVSCEEVFGPVVGVAGYGASTRPRPGQRQPFGLQAGIFTARVDARARVGPRLDFGGVLINEMPTFRADQMPYGGVKDSGNTREGPHYAVRAMTEQKLVIVQLPK